MKYRCFILFFYFDSNILMSWVIIKSSCNLKPNAQTKTGRLSLSELDQIGIITHAPAIFFYKPSLSNGHQEAFTSIITTLKDSLSRVLVPFYPLAGRVHWIGHGRLELHCNAMGIQFLEAESQSKLEDFGDFSEFSKFKNLIPHVDYTIPMHEIPLLFVQVTKFQCGGFSICFHVSHVVIDGQSALHFIAEWARIARGEPLGVRPVFDRKLLRAGDPPISQKLFHHKEFDELPLLLGQSNNYEERRKKTTALSLKLTKAQVEMLKNKANERKSMDNGGGYTRYETLAAHVWRSACKAREHKPEQPTAMGILIDARKRMEPQLPDSYFGNAIHEVIAVSTSGELVSKPLGFACGKIRDAIQNSTSDYMNSAIDFCKNQQDLTKFQDIYTLRGTDEGPSYGNPNLSLVSWLTLPIYGVDFGCGKEIYMGPGSLDCDGDAYLMQSHDSDGSLVLAICLQVAHIKAFQRYFYEDIM